MTFGTEKPTTKRTRIIWSVILWAIAVPLFIGLWILIGWWALVGIAFVAWGTWDWIQKGGDWEPPGGPM